MVQFIVRKLLKKFLGDFIDTDLDISVSLLSGEADLSNVSIKQDALKKMGMPLDLVYGRIGKLMLKVPYRHLSS